MAIPDPFRLVAPGVGMGRPLPPGWLPLSETRLAILVGLTGVGKSTAVRAAEALAPEIVPLPERRVLTDTCIIPLMWHGGGPHKRPPDRLERLDCTRRFRAQYPGGMGFVLSQLAVDPCMADAVLLFDGLRGDQEVSFAVRAFPAAQFVVMQAPDVVRLLRLLRRNDAFDKLYNERKVPEIESLERPVTGDWAALSVAGAEAIFTMEEQSMLLALVQGGQCTTAELRAKLRIVVEERRNYDPDAAWQVLRAGAPTRATALDTASQRPDQIARGLVQYLRGSGPPAGLSASVVRRDVRPFQKKVV